MDKERTCPLRAWCGAGKNSACPNSWWKGSVRWKLFASLTPTYSKLRAILLETDAITTGASVENHLKGHQRFRLLWLHPIGYLGGSCHMLWKENSRGSLSIVPLFLFFLSSSSSCITAVRMATAPNYHTVVHVTVLDPWCFSTPFVCTADISI